MKSLINQCGITGKGSKLRITAVAVPQILAGTAISYLVLLCRRAGFSDVSRGGMHYPRNPDHLINDDCNQEQQAASNSQLKSFVATLLTATSQPVTWLAIATQAPERPRALTECYTPLEVRA